MQAEEPAAQPTPPTEPQPAPPVPNPKRGGAGIKIGIIAAVVVLLAAAALLIGLLTRGGGGEESPAGADDAAVSAFETPAGSFNSGADSPDDPAAASEDPAPSSEPTASEPGTSEPAASPPAAGGAGTTDLSGLYIGTWIAAGQREGDEQNGWTALHLNSVKGSSVTFSLEKIQSAPASRIADTDPITVTMKNGTGTFPVSDSWGNSGTGEITVKGGAIHVQVSITNPAPMSLWDISMDTDFYPETVSAGSTDTAAAVPDSIAVALNGKQLALSQAPYIQDGQVMVPMTEVFRAAGVQVFQEGSGYICLTKSASVVFSDYGDEWLYAAVNGPLDDFSIPTSWVNNVLFVPCNLLDRVFGLSCGWDAATQTLSVTGSIASSERVSDATVSALRGFDLDTALRRVQDAGYTFVPAGCDTYYVGAVRYWAVPVAAAEGTQYVVISYDGTYYNII